MIEARKKTCEDPHHAQFESTRKKAPSEIPIAATVVRVAMNHLDTTILKIFPISSQNEKPSNAFFSNPNTNRASSFNYSAVPEQAFQQSHQQNIDPNPFMQRAIYDTPTQHNQPRSSSNVRYITTENGHSEQQRHPSFQSQTANFNQMNSGGTRSGYQQKQQLQQNWNEAGSQNLYAQPQGQFNSVQRPAQCLVEQLSNKYKDQSLIYRRHIDETDSRLVTPNLSDRNLPANHQGSYGTKVHIENTSQDPMSRVLNERRQPSIGLNTRSEPPNQQQGGHHQPQSFSNPPLHYQGDNLETRRGSDQRPNDERGKRQPYNVNLNAIHPGLLAKEEGEITEYDNSLQVHQQPNSHFQPAPEMLLRRDSRERRYPQEFQPSREPSRDYAVHRENKAQASVQNLQPIGGNHLDQAKVQTHQEPPVRVQDLQRRADLGRDEAIQPAAPKLQFSIDKAPTNPGFTGMQIKGKGAKKSNERKGKMVNMFKKSGGESSDSELDEIMFQDNKDLIHKQSTSMNLQQKLAKLKEKPTEEGASGSRAARITFEIDTAPVGIVIEGELPRKILQKDSLTTNKEAIKEKLEEDIQVEQSEVELEPQTDMPTKRFVSSGSVSNSVSTYKVLGQDKVRYTRNTNIAEKLENYLVKEENAKEPDEQKEKPKAEDEAEDEAQKELDEYYKFDNRYYLSNPTKVCRRCKQPGHFERMCPEMFALSCLFCLAKHATSDCDSVICFKCNNIGHRVRECRMGEGRPCYRCNKKGHKINQCGVILPPRAHLTDEKMSKEKQHYRSCLICLTCGKLGHVNCNIEEIDIGTTEMIDNLYGRQDNSEFEASKDVNPRPCRGRPAWHSKPSKGPKVAYEAPDDLEKEGSEGSIDSEDAAYLKRSSSKPSQNKYARYEREQPSIASQEEDHIGSDDRRNKSQQGHYRHQNRGKSRGNHYHHRSEYNQRGFPNRKNGNGEFNKNKNNRA